VKHLLDDLQDGLSQEEEQLAASINELDADAIANALALRTAVKAQSIAKSLYLSDASIDAITTALLNQ
jgi:GAF domain-containing protein